MESRITERIKELTGIRIEAQAQQYAIQEQIKAINVTVAELEKVLSAEGECKN